MAVCSEQMPKILAPLKLDYHLQDTSLAHDLQVAEYERPDVMRQSVLSRKELAPFALKRALTGYSGSVGAVAFLLDGAKVVSSRYDHTMQ